MLTVREATVNDCNLLWDWVNDPTVRESAFSSDLIPWETHFAWFRQKLNDPNCVIYIALSDQADEVGQIRFDINGSEATVDVSVAANYRGKGIGKDLIQAGLEQLKSEHIIRSVHAYIKESNIASQRAFVRAGFIEAGHMVHGDHPCVHMQWGYDE